jgi:tetratricopeptide (TPR) repeat protein
VRSTALVACLLLSVAPAGAAEWVRVETPNFIVYGETGAGRVREVAEEFERFRDALGRVIPGAERPAAVPTVVVVFNSARSFEPYVPRYKGKPIKLGGYFFSSDDMNIVAFADGKRNDLLRTIFHEYVHLVIDNVSDGMPLWLNEGLAEYYSTFEVEAGGRGALIGRAIPAHLDLLTHQRHFPIPELLAVDADSPSYNEGERQTLFYAQSWALVHMLVSGTPNRSSLLGQYGRLVAGGTPSLDAWRQIFKDAPIGRELEGYVGRDTLSGFRYRFSQTIPTVKSYSSRVSEGDAQAVLGDLLRRVAEADETSARFEKAITLQPVSARALALYGLLRLDEDEPDKALPLLMAAARDKTDWLVQYHVATGLTRVITTTDDPEPAVIATARDALAIAQAARPDLANGHALAARIDIAADSDATRTLQSIRRARAVSPGRDDYIIVEAFALMRLGEYIAARQLLAPLTSSTQTAGIRASAEEVMEQIAVLERQAEEFGARLEGQKLETARTGRPRREAPVYRPLQPGESRVEGLLERINCAAKEIVIEVNVAGTTERFVAESLNSLAFISHRDDLRSMIACTLRTPPDRVYVTWRLADPPSRLRQVIAVEFLPLPR